MKTWIKLYTRIIDDFDQGTLTWAQRGIWSAMLALCGKIDDRDADGNETGILETPESVCWSLRLDKAELDEAMKAFSERGMAEVRDGVIWLPNYGDRQERKPSDNAERIAERVKRHRSAKQSQGDQDVTPCNADVTPCNADVTPLKRPVTRSDTDTEEIQIQKRDREEADADAKTAAAGVLESFWEQKSGLLNPVHAFQLGKIAEWCSFEDFKAGFEEAVRTKPPGRFPPNYVGAICERWKSTGGNRHGPPGADPTQVVLDRLIQETADRWQQGSGKQGSTTK